MKTESTIAADKYSTALKQLKSIKRRLAKADEKMPFLSEINATEELDKNGPVGVECRRLIASIV
jgi:hypothetical protein